MAIRKQTLSERFHSYLSEENKNGCIEWIGAKISGYGAMSICDKKSKYKYNAAHFCHRISYELFIGKIPKKQICMP